jgi:hypothetical protein
MSKFKGNPNSTVQIKTSNSKRAHSEDLEFGCLSLFSLPLLDYHTVSQGEREGEGLDVCKN